MEELTGSIKEFLHNCIDPIYEFRKFLNEKEIKQFMECMGDSKLKNKFTEACIK